MSTLYLDVETTGNRGDDIPNYLKDEIVEVSFLLEMYGIVSEVGSYRVKHELSCSAEAYEIHGIADFMCDTPKENIIPKLCSVLSNAEAICGHNISFDIERLKAWGSKALTRSIESKQVICTMKDYPQVWKTVYSGSGRDKRIRKAYSSLWDCESYMINSGRKGYSEKELLEEFKNLFKDSNLAKHHSSAYDTFICYKFRRFMKS